jgi:DNA primase
LTASTAWSEWKKRVSIPQLLEAIGHTEHFRLVGKRLTGPCPVHRGDNPHAFQVDLERNLWFCFSRCCRGGDVVDLARCLSGGSWSRAAQWLEQLSCLESMTPGQPATPLEPSKTQARALEFRPFRRALRLVPDHPFFLALGLTPATVHRFEAGAWQGPGFLEATVAVRLHDPAGNPLGYAGRRLDTAAIARWGKWKWPPGFPKALTLWNWHRIQPTSARGVILVEGPWSVMKLWQAGFDNAVALCGLGISYQQRQLLSQSRHITLFLDGDQAGIRASARHAASKFHPHLRVVQPPPDRDPADLSQSQLLRLLKPSTP